MNLSVGDLIGSAPISEVNGTTDWTKMTFLDNSLVNFMACTAEFQQAYVFQPQEQKPCLVELE